ncbi:anhydro-N-acetylmuramic acid kinase [Vibrio profundum]|uniref:anhydro-N-acetylmuramic acid kinase n=1 Tax=Vibrio profundum TaxID=2910247 RepID=UPI003D0A8FBC
MNKEWYIGVMSGTSLDGVDCALVEIEDERVRLLAHRDFPFPIDLKQTVLDVCLGKTTSLPAIGELDHQLGHLFANAILQLLEQHNIKPEQVRAIGNHGQTVFHQPSGENPFTLQLGDANIIAQKTGIDTVADFRRLDMALGGQGAPLVPAFHRTIFRPTDSTVVVLNIGGIANISVLRPNEKVIGYDTGPGNMLMDAWCQKHRQESYDKGAQFAQQGVVLKPLLTRMLSDTYFSSPTPKSTGRERFNLDWLNACLRSEPYRPEDVQRTLLELSAVSICNEVALYVHGHAPELLVCGGGAHNPLLMQRLMELLPDWRVQTTNAQGVDGDNMEAMAFAWLAQRRVHNLPSNLPEVTGARGYTSLGCLYLAPHTERI